MNLEKLKVFAELQDQIMKLTEGRVPLVTFYLEEHGMAIHNPFLDVTGRFEVDPIKEYGKENLEVFESKIVKIEAEMGCLVEEMSAHDLRLYLGGKFFLGKEPSLECFEKIGFEDEPEFMRYRDEYPVDDTINFYVPLFVGWEELIPEAALKLICPVDEDKQVNLYLDYDIPNKDIMFVWTTDDETGRVSVPKEVKEGLLTKMDVYVKSFGEESLEKMASEQVNEQIWDALEKAVQKEWYAQPDDNGNYSIEISADYRETNEELLEGAYNNRESVELKNSIIDEITESYEEAIWDYEIDLLDKSGFDMGCPYREQAKEIMWENVSFSPDYDHFMKGDMRVNLLLGTDWERNVEFTDIKHNLARWTSKKAFAEMQEDAKKYGDELREPDNALLWLIKQQGYTLEDLGKVNEAYKEFFYGVEDGSRKYGSYEKAYKVFVKDHSPLLSSICECLDNQTYSMGCVTVLMKSSLEEYCELFERDSESKELVPREIVIPKDAYLTIHNPWDGAGCMGWIELEKDLVVPNDMIFDSEIEGVKRDHGWTVDGISGLVGSCWKESKGVRDVQKEIEKPSLDAMIHGTLGRTGKNGCKEVSKGIDKETER